MSGRGREALCYVLEWSVDPPLYPGVVGRPFGMFGSCREALQMFGCDQEALPDVRDWWGCPPESPGVVERPSQMSGSDREALPDVREC